MRVSCLDYFLDVLIPWSYQLGLYAGFCLICFRQILLQISGLWLLLLLYFICVHPALPLVFYSTSLLLLSYYTIHVPCLISIAISLPAAVCLCYETVFNACLWFIFIDTLVLVPAHHLTFTTPLFGGFWLPWILMSRSQSLELLDSPGC